jgi:alginate O-acetyltransferase complex protein AlgI
MSLYSVESLLLLFTFAGIFFLLPGTRSRQFAFAAGSIGFLYSYMPDLLSWTVLMAFLLSGFGCALLLRIWPSRILFTTYITLLVVSFAILKKYDFITWCFPDRLIDLPVAIVGLSYMLFRQIHFVVDVMQGQIEQPTLWTYLNYQLNPFALLAGPIQRYQDFQEYWSRPAPLLVSMHEALKAYIRLFIGVIKVVVFSNAFRAAYYVQLTTLEGETTSGSEWRAAGRFILMIYSFMFYLYLNFSGYCDIVIAGASLIGLRLPENFRSPFVARNILDYWTRWHITLGQWIRDYLFTPVYKAGVEQWPAHGTTVAVAGYLLAFTVAGVWHGSTGNFLIFGLLHGVGASAAKLWETAIVKYSGRSGLKRYLKSAPIRWVATAGTFHYTCFTLLFFAMDLQRGQRILGKVVGAFVHGY